MSAQDYYNNGGGGGGYPPSQSQSPYPNQPQYASSPAPYPTYPPQQQQYGGHSPYPSQPSYAHSPAPPSSQTHLSPYPLQPQYARPGSAHSDAGHPPPPYPEDRTSPLPRPHSADPYASEKQRDQSQYSQQYAEGEDGERGLGATLLGGGAGGLLGHKLGKGKFGTFLGSAVGAVAANVIENKMEGKHGKHGHGHGGHHGSPYGHGGHGGSSGGLLGIIMVDITADITDITAITVTTVTMATTDIMAVIMKSPDGGLTRDRGERSATARRQFECIERAIGHSDRETRELVVSVGRTLARVAGEMKGLKRETAGDMGRMPRARERQPSGKQVDGMATASLGVTAAATGYRTRIPIPLRGRRVQRSPGRQVRARGCWARDTAPNRRKYQILPRESPPATPSVGRPAEQTSKGSRAATVEDANSYIRSMAWSTQSAAVEKTGENDDSVEPGVTRSQTAPADEAREHDDIWV
ncbi:hypothetical protein F5Y15DRAFT_423295 [Xylariaceae sp. FL0016]|nr:hypothetical protein F5Y15DRAFT_423295 [Xylariaceae sp. FL0016]